MKTPYDNAMKAEADSWCIADPQARSEKAMRERIRYPKIIKDLRLNDLELTDKTILDIGAGPISILTCLDAGVKLAVEPLHDEYRKFYYPSPEITWYACEGEKLPFAASWLDVAVSTNSLDHCADPKAVIKEATRVLKYSGYLAVMCCERLAEIHLHPAHLNSITYRHFRAMVDNDFETVHELSWAMDGYRYGWVNFRGRVGQPAFCWLGRKTKGM